MAKIHKPQDQNGIDLINQTVFNKEHDTRVAREDDLQTKLTSITGYTFEEITSEKNINTRISVEVQRAVDKESEIANNLALETQRATDAESSIENKLNEEIERSINEDNNLAIAIKEESDRASVAEEAINEKLDSFLDEKIHIESETLVFDEQPIFNATIEQKFQSSETYPITVRGFGDIIEKSGRLISLHLSCPRSSNTSNTAWLKIFEKSSEGNIFIGISDNSDVHGLNESIDYTFNNSQIWLYANKEYYFVFCSDAQKDYTIYYKNEHSIDCCLKGTDNIASGGILGSNGYTNTDKKPIYNIFLTNMVENKADLNLHINDNIAHISEKERELWNTVSGETSFSNNFPFAATDQLNTYGFMIKSPKNGFLKSIKVFCRESGSAVGGETYLKIWDDTNNCIACSINKFTHSLNAVQEYIFENLKLEKDRYYKFSYITDENEKHSSNTDANVQVCLKSTTTFDSGINSDLIFDGYTLDKTLNKHLDVQVIMDIEFYNNIEKIQKEISILSQDISAIGLDIDAINETINSITEPKLEILVLNSDPSSSDELVDEITLDIYTTDESGVTTPVDTLPDINISYQSTDGFIYTSNAVAYSPFINVVLSEENNQYTETGENNISEGRPQHDATLKFSGLSGIKEDITRVIIFDAIVAGDSSNGYNKCKHISRILPVHFRVAPSTPEES